MLVFISGCVQACLGYAMETWTVTLSGVLRTDIPTFKDVMAGYSLVSEKHENSNLHMQRLCNTWEITWDMTAGINNLMVHKWLQF